VIHAEALSRLRNYESSRTLGNSRQPTWFGQQEASVFKLNKGGFREPLELRVLAPDEIVIPNSPVPTLNGFNAHFDIQWKKPVDKKIPSWLWRYSAYNNKGEQIGDGAVGQGERIKLSPPHDGRVRFLRENGCLGRPSSVYPGCCAWSGFASTS
jgi:hypothetical protein